ncbi:MAG: hypothetical protein MUC88_11535 [Planctomycetes bacterium]|jgi:hypothetical protein|nr:hypothetical protein [Planctomycetota bacterium]
MGGSGKRSLPMARKIDANTIGKLRLPLPPWLSPLPGWWHPPCQTGDLTAPAFLGQKREDRQPDPRFCAKNANIAKIVNRHPRF